MGWVIEVGVYKSVDVCTIDFAVGREGRWVHCFLSLRMITVVVKSVVGWRLT